MLHDIVDVTALPDHRLKLRFDDGIEGEIDVKRLIELDGVFEPLRNEAEFRKVRVNPEWGTICWPNGADLDPIVLYAEVTGKSVEEVLASAPVR